MPLRIRTPVITSPPAPPPAGSSVMWIRVAGVWKQAIVWIRQNGTWKQASPKINVGGTWK